jgi:hypothetical protein
MEIKEAKMEAENRMLRQQLQYANAEAETSERSE